MITEEKDVCVDPYYSCLSLGIHSTVLGAWLLTTRNLCCFSQYLIKQKKLKIISLFKHCF